MLVRSIIFAVFICLILCLRTSKQKQRSKGASRARNQAVLEQLANDSQEWKAMKLVILGNGQVGKTTMLHAIKGILNNSQVCYSLFITLVTP
jgi:hypothetical protein